MTTATDHKNNLNRSTIKKNFSRALRVETIANSAGGTAAVAQPSTGFLNGHFYARRSWRRGQTAGGGSIPRWSTGKPQVVTRRKATGAGAGKKKNNGHFYADGSPTEDTEDCLGRITVGLTRSKSPP